jgi:hypothetical protein
MGQYDNIFDYFLFEGLVNPPPLGITLRQIQVDLKQFYAVDCILNPSNKGSLFAYHKCLMRLKIGHSELLANNVRDPFPY